MSNANTSLNVSIAQKQLDAYNAQDLDSYVSYFAEDCVVSGLNGQPTETNRAAIKARYGCPLALPAARSPCGSARPQSRRAQTVLAGAPAADRRRSGVTLARS